jgi:hypothetical protein
VWRQHGAAAAATMIDSGDVHQLRAIAEPDDRLRIRHPDERDTGGTRGSILIAVTHRRSADHDRAIRELVIPVVVEVGVRTLGLYTSDPTENTFPSLPVRPSNVLMWVAAGDTIETLDDAARQLSIARRQLAVHATANNLDEVLLDVLRLEPTQRSCLNGADIDEVITVGPPLGPEQTQSSFSTAKAPTQCPRGPAAARY